MTRDEQIDMFMILVKSDICHTKTSIEIILNGMKEKNIESLNDIDTETAMLYAKLIAKRNTLEHIESIAKTCFKL